MQKRRDHRHRLDFDPQVERRLAHRRGRRSSQRADQALGDEPARGAETNVQRDLRHEQRAERDARRGQRQQALGEARASAGPRAAAPARRSGHWRAKDPEHGCGEKESQHSPVRRVGSRGASQGQGQSATAAAQSAGPARRSPSTGDGRAPPCGTGSRAPQKPRGVKRSLTRLTGSACGDSNHAFSNGNTGLPNSRSRASTRTGEHGDGEALRQ